MTDSIKDALKSLHTSAIDARNGYDEALKDSESPKDLAGLFARMRDLHDRNAAELVRHLQQLGEEPDAEGSFMSAVHRIVMDIRSWFGGLDESVLAGLIDGETRNLSKYDAALSDRSISSDVMRTLSDQRTRIAGAIDAMRASKRAAA